MKVLFVVLLGVVLAAALSPEQVTNKFIEFQNTYGRFYPTSSEYNNRLSIFTENLKFVEEMNANSENPVFGITKYMDVSREEFANTVLMRELPVQRDPKRGPYQAQNFTAAAPSSYDWRTHSPSVVTPVYNQGQCGSCWAFSATENVESQWALAGNSLTKLSMQQVVDCDTTSYGCGGGWPYLAYAYLESAGGQDSYASYPYTAENGQCVFKSADVVAKLSGWSYVTKDESESEMVSYLVEHGPLSVCVDASSWQFYSSGVYMASDCSTSIDHCVEAIGYNTGASTPYWIIRNSWGTDWGLNGYMHLQYGKDACAVAQVVTNAHVA
eukprot:TRINITY_DN18_c0_g2_i1.p1 TRINITY_DN18_c0_g2~~TRINITY_DN18_c0_g2_i1.p1  ORF type:complete len:326 (+),score=62.01 TRINITY_DN18_c0_g2_i1:25-1002(+)